MKSSSILNIERNHISHMVLLALFYSLATSLITIYLFYESFNCYALDLGYFTQSIKYTLEGKLLYTTIGGLSSLAYHFSPVNLLIVPVYWLFPYPQTLLVVQSVLLGFSGCLVYILCRINKLSHRLSMFIEMLFFFNPLVWGLATYDFHAIVFAIPALLTLFIGIQNNNKWLISIGLLIALCSKEDIILTTFIWAIWMTLYNYWKNKKIEKLYPIIATIALFAYGVAIATSAIASSGQFPRILTYFTVRYDYFSLPLSESIIAGLKTLFSKNAIYLTLAYLAPLGLLPLRNLSWCFPALVVLLSNIISPCPNQNSSLLQSQAGAIPYLFMAFILSVTWFKENPHFKNLSSTMSGRLPYYVCITLILISTSYVMTTRLRRAEFPNEHEANIKAVLELIPDDTTVTANNYIFPHICSRTDSYLPYWTDKYTPIESGEWGFPDNYTEYVVMDNFYRQPYGKKALWEYMFKEEIHKHYQLVVEINGTKLYRLRNP